MDLVLMAVGSWQWAVEEKIVGSGQLAVGKGGKC